MVTYLQNQEKTANFHFIIYPRAILGYYRRRYSTYNIFFERVFNLVNLRIGAVSSAGRAVDF